MMHPAEPDVLPQGTLWMLDLGQPLPVGPVLQVPVVFMRAGPEVAQELAQAMNVETSKKRSGANLPSPPERWVFFVDRCLGRRIIPGALRNAGEEISVHDDFFPQDQQTRVARIIGVWLLQRCAARAQRTIRHQLDAPNGQPVAEFRPALQKLAP